ncbi:MAG: phosphoribosylformylglycinamidine cyclo-ligase [Leptonema sp. (in: bacteria)]
MVSNSNDYSLEYKKAGVDTLASQKLIESLKPYANKTLTKNVISGIGGFSALYDLSFLKEYKKPILLTSTDGVGTKLNYASFFKRYETIGYDLVAMCANDILVNGGKPYIFLDYLSVDRLHVEEMSIVLRSISAACKLINCSLIGGETAEHPNTKKHQNDFDLAGFMIGFCEQEKLLTYDNIQKGDIVIGVPSSGIHSNGVSLIRKIFFDPNDPKEENKEEVLAFVKESILLQPTILYEPILRPLLEENLIKGLVHITGGGFYENIPRILKENYYVELAKWDLEEPFDKVSNKGNLDFIEMTKIFNCGFGMLIFADKKSEAEILHILRKEIETYKKSYIENQKDFFYDFLEYLKDWDLKYFKQTPKVLGAVGNSEKLSKKIIFI